MKNTKILLIPLIIISFLTVMVTYKAFLSMKDQMILLSEFNSNNFRTPLSKILQMNSFLPNISVTTIPLDHMKANYFISSKKYKEAKSLIKSGNDKNPYLGFGDLLLSRIYKDENKLDSALFFATKAIDKLPNNGAHIQNFYDVVGENYELADEIYNKYSTYNDPIFWLAYINYSVNNPNKSKSELLKLTSYALENFNTRVDDFKKLENYLKFGIVPANYQNIVNEALKFFNDGNYNEAINSFEQATRIYDNDYAVFENLSIAYYMKGDYDNAMDNINIVIDKFSPKNGKSEMIKGLILVAIGDNILACEYFRSSLNKGTTQSKKYLNNYCEKQ